MSAEARQTLLQLALPALILGVGYIWFGAAEPQRKLAKLEERLAKQSTSPGVRVGAQRQRLRTLQEELQEAREERARASRQVTHLQGGSRDDEERHACEEALIYLFAQRGVRLEGSATAPAGFSPPPSLEAARAAARVAASRLRAPVKPTRRRRRTAIRRAATPQAPLHHLDHTKPLLLRLRGSYLDVLSALEALDASELDLLPLGLNLEARPPDGGEPRWILVVQP